MNHLALYANASAAATLTSLSLELSENETKRSAHSSAELYRQEVGIIRGAIVGYVPEAAEEQLTDKTDVTNRVLCFRRSGLGDLTFSKIAYGSVVGICDLPVLEFSYVKWEQIPSEPVGLRKDIQEVLGRILDASKSGNLRGAYRDVFNLLNSQFAKADYGLASSILRVVCATPYPSTVGIGALRFSSSVSSRISSWKALVRTVRGRLSADGILAEEDLRGLE